MTLTYLPRLLGLFMATSLWLGFSLVWAEPLAIIVNNTNPITSLKKSDIAAMYRGEELHWPNGGRIKLVNREIASPVRAIFYKNVLNAKSNQQFLRPGTPVAVQSLIQRSEEAVIRFVAAIEGAIGYVDLSKVNDNVNVVFILQEKDD